MDMRPEVEKFFNDRFGGFAGLIHVGNRRGEDPEAVMAACEKVYDTLSPDETKISIGQRVHCEARLLQKQKIDGREKRFRMMVGQLLELNSRVEHLENSRMSRKLKRWLKHTLLNWHLEETIQP